MNYHPILFSTPMVQANLDGIKTMTRRVMNPQPVGTLRKGYFSDMPNAWVDDVFYPHKPRFRVGDILWVRETWAHGCMGGYIYKSNHENAQLLTELRQWRPSIFMPKAAARIFLRVTGVRAERVQEIQTQDVHAEGVYLKECQRCLSENDECRPQLDVDVFCCMEDKAIDAFADIWDTCYAKPMPCKEKGAITCYISYPWEDVYETREHNGLPWEDIYYDFQGFEYGTGFRVWSGLFHGKPTDSERAAAPWATEE